MRPLRLRTPRGQRGAAAIEFAIVAGFGGFLVLLIGIMELGRVLFYLNTASETTRLGARVAVVCNIDAPAIKARMNRMLHLLGPDNINVTYNPSGCGQSTCQSVTVSIAPNVTVNTFIPFVPISIVLPPFTTTLPRESLDSTNNSLCTSP
jgi:Flp pilus assembly protein TadG